VRSKPIVALRVGKNALKERETTMLVSASASQYVFQSFMANMKPDTSWLLEPTSSGMPTSSCSLRVARRVSSRVRKCEEVLGKSGRMKMEQTATKIVSEPSI